MSELAQVGTIIEEAIAAGHLPGAVLLVGRGEETIAHVAIGHRRLVPSPQPMEPDTLFDCASLTKPCVTAILAMQLVEEGRLCLSEAVGCYIPSFSGEGRDDALLRDLLTHSSGLSAWKNYLDRPPTSAEDRAARLEAVVADVCATPLAAPPGQRFIYSDLGYILLGYIIEQTLDCTLAEAAAQRIFKPSGMTAACFNPQPEQAGRCAATEVIDGQPLQGVVHDENARYLGGIAGHAGLFATAADLAALCRVFLRAGRGPAGRVLSAASVRAMTEPQSRHPGQPRGLGWDVGSGYANSLRGDLFPPRGFGHSGFTGTSIWVDPPSGVFIVLLTNRVHPTREGNVLPLRRRIANAVAAALLDKPKLRIWVQPRSRVRTGLEVEAAGGWPSLRGKRIAVLVNHTAVDRQRRHLIDLLAACEDVQVVRILAPEHGLRGAVDERFPDGRDERTGLPIVSLYGDRLAPDPEHLADVDAILYDIQDAGVRFYTYTATMCLAMRAAADAAVEFIVFDRPSLLRPDLLAGPVLDKPFAGLAEYHPTPVVHGMTSAELARFANQEYDIGCELTVVPCEGYSRDLWYDATGLPWSPPSPNLRTPKAAVLYPCLGILERCDLSVGRGTDAPFEYFGAPWIDGPMLADNLNALELPAVAFVATQFTPSFREFAGQLCSGCYVSLLDRDHFRPVLTALHIARTLRRLYGDTFDLQPMAGLLGSEQAVARLAQLDDPEDIASSWNEELREYEQRRAQYLLY